jgi:hypothetical protein
VGGANGIYAGALYQRGQGVGGFLASLFKSCLPILRKRGLAVGKTLLNTGVDIMQDMGDNVSFKESYKNHKRHTMDRLRNNVITGEGYKLTQKQKRNQLSSGIRSNTTSKRRKKTEKSKTNSKPEKKKKAVSHRKKRDLFS